MYTKTSPILNTATPLDLDGLYLHWKQGGAVRLPDLIGYLNTVVSGAVQLGIDPVAMLAQFDVETNAGRSYWWNERRNPAGIGITGDPKQNAASQTWLDGHDAAFAHLAHMTAYLFGEDWVDHWPVTWPEPIDIDKRFAAPILAGYHARTLDDLNGTWAVDPEGRYGEKLAERANKIMQFAKETAPMAVTFGNVPHPPYLNRTAEMQVNRAWSALGKRTIRGVVWHRMIGTLWGTDAYFRGEAINRALTDYGIGVAAVDAKPGELLMWNDPRGERSPWANGSLNEPYGDGLAFYNIYGTTGINRDLASIEISGKYDTPLDPGARATLVALTAYWADQYNVSWETFPLIPGEGNRSFVLWHQEITIGTGKICPGQVVMGETAALIAQVKELLKNYQTSAPVPAPDLPQYAKPQPVPLGTRLINDRLFLGVTETYTIRKQVTPRLWAEATSPATGPDLMPGQNVKVTHVVKDVGIESDLTLVLEDGSRIAGSALV